METTNKHKEHKQMKTEFKLLIDEIKEQDRKVNQLQRDLGGKEHRIKLLESVTDTDNDIIEDLNKRIKMKNNCCCCCCKCNNCKGNKK